MSEGKKQRLKEYQKKNTVKLKSLNLIINIFYDLVIHY